MAQKVLLKEILFHRNKIEQLAQEIAEVYPEFSRDGFIETVLEKFPELELKARISWMAECFRLFLPAQYEAAVEVILRALPPPNNPTLSDGDFGDFRHAPYAEYIARNGCDASCLDLSLHALSEITKRFSAEDAIRSFIDAFPDQTLETLSRWSQDSHYHLRRLVSEGTRPKLPWARKIRLSVGAAIPLLDDLFADSTRYVTRSVANHMNDISKTHPDLVLDTLDRWKQSGKQHDKEMDYIIRHALRTLIKQGNPRAMAYLGYTLGAHVEISQFRVPPVVFLDEYLEFSFDITSSEDAQAVVDYTLSFPNASGEPSNAKVYKLATPFLKAGVPQSFSKRYRFRQDMTTRKIRPGLHSIALQVNGKVIEKVEFSVQSR
jgi:3-methyladenine DNA glycosylase AlkC